MSLQNEKQDIYELLLCLLENDLTDLQRAHLIKWSQNDLDAVNVYHDFVRTYSMISHEISSRIEADFGTSFDTQFDQALWEALSEYEKTAPEIDISAEKPQCELTQKVVYPTKERRKLNAFSKVILALNTAAVLFFVLFVRFVPPKGGVEVATLTDSINAKWADAGISIQSGTRLYNDKTPLLLREGLVEIKFDNNAQVTIEGPAEFQIVDSDIIKLNYGRIYSQIPPEAYGFQISTKHARIIDLGTEFGIEEGFNGNTEVHVFKGQVNLISNVLSKKINVNLLAGVARKLDVKRGELKEIPCDNKLFVRQIESKTNTVWRGQKTLDLADIIGGGDGLGTGKVDMGIDPVSGKLTTEALGTQASANDYRPVPFSPFIDGVFVPNGRTQQIVSSAGHLFQECPVTSGLCCESLFNVVRNLDELVIQDMKTSNLSSHCILLHANMGVTFDLNAIRTLLPEANIVRFKSKVGIRKWALRPSASNADFWILVDGKLRCYKKQVKISELSSIDIELSETDRFLTLIQTDGGDPEGRIMDDLILHPHDSDWGLFADPSLVLE